MLDKLKLMLGIEEADLDEKLSLILSGATSRLKILLGGTEPPQEMEHIILDVAIARFNRIGSEGLTGHTVEGKSLSFTENDFDQFSDEIQAWLSCNSESRGKLRFI